MKRIVLITSIVLILTIDTHAQGIWTNYTNGNYINDIAVEGDFIWCATDVGVVRWNKRDGTYIKYTPTDGLADNDVSAVAVDADNLKWFGLGKWSGGVSSFDGTTWETYTTKEGLASNRIQAIVVDTNNVKWFGTFGGGVSSFDGSIWKTYTKEDGLVRNNVRAVAVDADNIKWFGTSGGVSSFDGTTWTTYTTK